MGWQTTTLHANRIYHIQCPMIKRKLWYAVHSDIQVDVSVFDTHAYDLYINGGNSYPFSQEKSMRYFENMIRVPCAGLWHLVIINGSDNDAHLQYTLYYR